MSSEKTTKQNKKQQAPKIGLGFYTLGEEIANSITHGLGALLGIAGTVVLIVFAALAHDPWKIVSVCVYSFTMIFLFTMSTLYHAINNKRAKQVFRVFDHTSIYLLIAGTYTPFTLVTLRNSGIWGWCIFGVVWGVTVLGIVLSAVSLERFKVFEMTCYVASGWCIIVAMFPLIKALPLTAIVLLVSGGVAYTAGIAFFASSRKYWHSIWHLFVLAGAVLHYFCILLYVI